MADDPKPDEPAPIPPAGAPAQEEAEEQQFFARERAPSDIRRRPEPPSMVKRLIVVGAAAALLGGILWFTSAGDLSTLWIVNPGPNAVVIEVGSERNELEPGKMLDMRVRASPDVEVVVRRGRERDAIPVDLSKPDKQEVCIVDLGGDAAYVVLDASGLYKETPSNDPMPMIHVSKPHNLHYIPYPALNLVRPGRPLPERSSWELNTFRGSAGITMYKVFRVAAARLADQNKLAKQLNDALRTKQATAFENMTTIVDTSSKALIDGLIPRAR
jgi:hypothetical protein